MCSGDQEEHSFSVVPPMLGQATHACTAMCTAQPSALRGMRRTPLPPLPSPPAALAWCCGSCGLGWSRTQVGGRAHAASRIVACLVPESVARLPSHSAAPPSRPPGMNYHALMLRLANPAEQLRPPLPGNPDWEGEDLGSCAAARRAGCRVHSWHSAACAVVRGCSRYCTAEFRTAMAQQCKAGGPPHPSPFPPFPRRTHSRAGPRLARPRGALLGRQPRRPPRFPRCNGADAASSMHGLLLPLLPLLLLLYNEAADCSGACGP